MLIGAGICLILGATGTLTLDITEFDYTNCDPRIGICYNFREMGTLSGRITR